MSSLWKYRVSGIDDELFVRGNVPMTKSEVRAVTLSKLRLSEESYVLDIGAGTGSVTVECALIAKEVTAIERCEEGTRLIRANGEHFDVISSMKVIMGMAPRDLPHAYYNRVFIGGSGGQLESIFDYLDTHLIDGGILVANAITIESASSLLALLESHGYKEIEAVQIAVSRSRAIGHYHMMMGENPITILSARKG